MAKYEYIPTYDATDLTSWIVADYVNLPCIYKGTLYNNAWFLVVEYNNNFRAIPPIHKNTIIIRNQI